MTDSIIVRARVHLAGTLISEYQDLQNVQNVLRILKMSVLSDT
jgi:hypothetical protein